ncbi:polysaccharide pyruvyl transferase family protein [Gloeocapsopsis dulcis]|uniref:Polysaccharide pyruvyl transferase domain-containing protein n=1 Tax=Gloeocapsopsis dulcis AAB1 = 1H9 TaxID=1433147 RepID=A0A6N8FT14_9CHRO|nr:polysaccharide pyruvyl transferase family protein [Gloeocapsopsis dulcis]MUL35712.1 hypothetical protein [Gloeocapsopsis dulcis AAB1 = 1H9]WNN91005.1 polysaccharide pyruvyl transferase family protein [Gloeocapsopsis dulcis]
MNFSIYGVNFFNKGAELMLHAVKQQIHQWDRNNTLSAHLKIGSFEKRRQAGINHLAWASWRDRKSYEGSIANFTASLVPKSIRKKYAITLESEIDVILDASGFAFSDQWGSAKAERTAEVCSQWKKQGKKIILLPQAFGPFTSESIKGAMIKIINNVDLIFARDELSYEYLHELAVPLENVKIAPDFTNLVRGVEPEYIEDLTDRPCIIPNNRMMDKTSSAVSNQYLSFLVASIKHLLEQGLEPFILIHEANDFALAKQLQSQVSPTVSLVQEENPLHLKYILGKCHLVISSRFHGLISALSQGTPCLGTGWSHKYQMLFKSYDCLEVLVNFEDSLEENLSKLDLIIHQPTRAKIIESIEHAANHQKELSQKMWVEVKQLIDCKDRQYNLKA